MKKRLPFLMISLILFICSIFSACQYDSPKSIVGAQLNDKGELILTYSDDTTQNLGVVKGENGKDGKDGVDLTPCAHVYGDWTTVLAPSCTSIGYDTRSCSLCGDLDYLITNPLGHTYENPVDVINSPCQHWVNKTCTTCGDTTLVEEPASKEHLYGDWETVEEYACGAIKQEKSCIYCNEKQIQTIDFFAHTFNENTLCTTCGYQEFIESEEYIENIIIPPQTIHFGQSVPGIIWWNKDKTYGLKISLGNPSYLFLLGYVGTPVHVRLPASYNEAPLGTIGFSSDEPEIFRNCTTLKTIYIPDTVTRIEAYAFDGCTNLETVRFSENLTSIGGVAFRNCTSLKKLDFKNNNSGGLDFWHSFNNCTSLKEIYFPLQARTYNDSTSFENCALEKIYISEQYRSYYEETFYASYPNLQIISYE